MSIWDEFSDDELAIILECDKFSEIKRKFRRKFNRERWLAYARSYYELNDSPKFDPERIMLTMNDGNIGILTLLGIIGSIVVALIPLSIIAPILCLSTFVSSIIFYISAYREGKDKANQTVKDFDLLALKIQCAHELIQRKQSELRHSCIDQREISRLQQAYRDQALPAFAYKSKTPKFSPTLKFGMLTSSILFGTYYCGLAITLHAFGVLAISAAMLGVVGVSVAIGVAIVIGIFCAYKRYQAIVAQERIDQFKEYQKATLKDLLSESSDLQQMARTVQPEQAYQHRMRRSLSAPVNAFFNSKIVNPDQTAGTTSTMRLRPC
jgi:hypothetical protein